MAQDILITPGSGIPQISFAGSGTSTSGIELNIQEDSELSFAGYQGELLNISPELQSGTIFAVKDISGLEHISVNASGEIKLNEHYGYASISGAIKTPLIANADAATITFDLNSGNTHGVTLGDNRTFAISNESAGQKFMLRVLQEGTGSRTVTWFSTIKWAGGSAPTLTTTASKADVFGFLCTAADAYDGFVVGQNI